MTKTASRLCFVILALCSMLASAAPVGGVVETEGTVFVTSPEGKRRIVAVGSILEKGDTIQTEKQSTAKIRYADGSEMFVRPSSNFVIKDFNFDEKQPDKDSFVLDLVRGGLRQITGLIGKRGNQDAYRLNSPTSTMGIRGTDFTARLCQAKECGEGGKDEKLPASNRLVAAKLIDAKGHVTALQANGQRRDLAVDGSIYQEDLVEVGASGYAALLFSDETRVVLPGNSSFRVASYRFNAGKTEKTDKGDNGKMFLDVVKGSFRMVTGLIGKRNPANVSVNTGTATIGIRGTSFDLVCVPAGIDNPESYGGGSGGSECGEGLYSTTRDGAISLTSRNGQVAVFAAGQTAFVGSPDLAPVQLRQAPAFLEQLPAPEPEKFPIDIPTVFGILGDEVSDIGLFVTVTEGRVVIMQAQRELQLSTGESGFASGTSERLQRLITPPSFLIRDQKQSQQSMGFKGCRI